MKKYLVCVNVSCTTGVDLEHKFTLMADDVTSATVAANQILDAVKSQLGFITKSTVKYLREITE